MTQPYATARWRALGTYVQLVVHPFARADAAVEHAVGLLDEVDRACSRFRPDSDLSRVNAGAGTWVRTGRLLPQALSVALTAARVTDGAVDPTLGLVLRGLGYDRDLAEVRRAGRREGGAAPRPGAASVPAPRAVGSWRDVRLDPDRGVLVPFGRALDLGATGKAFAADLIARTLPAELGVDVLVSLGGDVAAGTRGDGAPHPWRVVVCERPEDAEGDGTGGHGTETVSLPAGGLATSSVVRRRWQHQGRERHHLVDPRTGAPARTVWRTASVVADDCTCANAASTAAVVLGERALGWLTARGLAARLVAADGTVVRTAGWPAARPAPAT